MTRALLTLFTVLTVACPALAQDIRGLEVCTAEKTMERRTACLQSNTEFLQQALAKQAHDTRNKLDAASREVAAQKAEIAALKSALAKLQHELAESKKKNRPRSSAERGPHVVSRAPASARRRRGQRLVR